MSVTIKYVGSERHYYDGDNLVRVDRKIPDSKTVRTMTYQSGGITYEQKEITDNSDQWETTFCKAGYGVDEGL